MTEIHEEYEKQATEKLIADAFRLDSEDDTYWDILSELWRRPTMDTLLQGKQLCMSQAATERELGANLLAQLGARSDALHEERLQALLALVEQESDAQVLAAATMALGHLHDERVVEPLLRFKNHPSEEVRYGVVHGLSGQHAEEAVAALIELSADENSNARDWATFELGSILDDIDTPLLRDALFARTEDPDDDTRGEALVGLARRKDERVIEPLIRELRSPNVGSLAVDAAHLMADSRLCAPLIDLKAEIGDDSEVEEALASCGCGHVALEADTAEVSP